jgi:hypothetical protein
MYTSYETQANKKAFLYTAIICAILLLLFWLIKFKSVAPTTPIIQDLMEINLGNEDEGLGDVQPLIKGNPTPSENDNYNAAASGSNDNTSETDDNADDNAASLVKPTKEPNKNPSKTPTATTEPVKEQKAKLTYNGNNSGANGNNANEDNGYKYQGNNPNGKGDKGDPNGNKDSYGTQPGGSTGGPRVTKGNRKIVKAYSFTGELDKATIYAKVKVSPSGQGTFIDFDKGSTSRNQSYAQAIRNYLSHIQFDKSEEESTVTVQFIFTVN